MEAPYRLTSCGDEYEISSYAFFVQLSGAHCLDGDLPYGLLNSGVLQNLRLDCLIVAKPCWFQRLLSMKL